MRSERSLSSGAVALLACALASPARAQDARAPSVDEALRWEGERHATLGPTGARVFALELGTSPGCRGRFACGDASLLLCDPLRLEIARDGEPLALEPCGTLWFPSRLEALWRAGALALGETKLVTDADAIVDELVLTNTGAEPLDLELRVSSGVAQMPERCSTRQNVIDLGALATLAPARGVPALSAQPPTRAVWVEAEHPAAGASGARVQELRDASGFRALDGFALAAGERLEWTLVAPPLAHPLLRVRCASRARVPRSLAVEIEGHPAGTLVVPPAGERAAWNFVDAPLAPQAPGRVRLALLARDAGEAVCLDGFFVCEADEPPLALPPGGAFVASVPEQLELPPGELIRDGVRFVLPAPDPARPTLVALRGAGEHDPAHELPERLRLAPPGQRPTLATLHLLGALELPRGAREDRPAARFVVELDDGSTECVPWPAPRTIDGPLPLELDPALAARVECRACTIEGLSRRALQFAYQAPPGRCPRSIELVSAGGPEVPLLLAATQEFPRSDGRLSVLVRHAALAATPVEFALALENGIPARGPDGERRLVSLVSLAPGATLRTRALLACGERELPTALQALELVRDEGLLARHVAACEAWYGEHVPAFRCSDRALEQAWRERWYVVRHDLRRLDLPDFSLPVAYEGTCCTSHALRDLPAAQGSVRALLKRQLPDGRILPQSPAGSGAPEAHALADGVLDVYAVDGSRPGRDESIGLLAREPAMPAEHSPRAQASAAEDASALVAHTRRLDALVREAIRPGAPAEMLARVRAELADLAQVFLEQGRPARAVTRAELAGEGAQGAGCVDLLRGACADLLVRCVAGLVPRDDGVLELRPLVRDLAWFRFERLPYHGHLVDVGWRAAGAALPPDLAAQREGFEVRVDGRLVFHSETLQPFVER